MNKIRVTRIVLVGAAVICAASLSSMFQVNAPSIRATKDLVIEADGRTLAILPAGSAVAIERCRDDKHGITPLVIIGDRAGEPATRDYSVEWKKRALLDGLPNVSCQ